MACRLSLVVTIAIGLARGSLGAAPNTFCQEYLHPGSVAASTLYAPRGEGAYCDGSVFEPNAGGELAVIGVVAFQVRGDPTGSPLALTVLAAPLGVEVTWPLHLQGIARSPDINYRLDAGLSSAAQPVVIGRESAMNRVVPRLSAGDVAWSAWSESSRYGRLYLPVIPAGIAYRGNVEITVRPTMATSYVTYSVASSSGAALTKEMSVPGPVKIADPVSISISPGTPQIIVVKVLAIGSDGEMQAASIRLVRPPGLVRK
jgi:hypothetical protein